MFYIITPAMEAYNFQGPFAVEQYLWNSIQLNSKIHFLKYIFIYLKCTFIESTCNFNKLVHLLKVSMLYWTLSLYYLDYVIDTKYEYYIIYKQLLITKNSLSTGPGSVISFLEVGNMTIKVITCRYLVHY